PFDPAASAVGAAVVSAVGAAACSVTVGATSCVTVGVTAAAPLSSCEGDAEFPLPPHAVIKTVPSTASAINTLFFILIFLSVSIYFLFLVFYDCIISADY